VVFPDFQVRGILSNEETGAHTLSVNPLVFNKDLEAWNEFAVNNQEWMAQAHMYDKEVNKEIYEMEHYDSEYPHDQTVRWNVTGISPFMWKYNATDRYIREPVDEALVYTPIWQRAPPCDYATQVNMNLASYPAMTEFIDAMLALDHPVITHVVEATYLETNYEYRFDPEEYAEPHSYVLHPVYDSLLHNRSAVAFISAFIRWGVFFTDVLPAHEQDIYVVLENTCGQTHTYEIFGHEPVYKGEGNLHDTGVDEDNLEDTFEFSPETAKEDEEGKHKLCHYIAHVYPSPVWRSKFFTSNPYTYAAAVMCCFIITAFGFIMYDCLVQARQKKVMKSAARTNAIVSSLFPENVRDRLLNEATNEGGPMSGKPGSAGKRRDSWSDPSGAFLTSKNANKQAGETQNSSEAIFGSKPIADLFPATTIMFADMVGFTAWSSVREPSQVFTLLETVYHSFDLIAKRRRVFKGMF